MSHLRAGSDRRRSSPCIPLHPVTSSLSVWANLSRIMYEKGERGLTRRGNPASLPHLYHLHTSTNDFLPHGFLHECRFSVLLACRFPCPDEQGSTGYWSLIARQD